MKELILKAMIEGLKQSTDLPYHLGNAHLDVDAFGTEDDVENLKERLKSLGVLFEDEPYFRVTDPLTGWSELVICVSYSPDPGYSVYYRGVGNSLEECVKNLKDMEED